MEIKPSKREQDLIAAFYLKQRDRVDAEEYAELGESFIYDNVVKDRRSDFEKAVANLENIHCHRDVIFRSLYRLRSAIKKVPEIPNSKFVFLLAKNLKSFARDLELLRSRAAQVEDSGYSVDIPPT